MTRAAGYYKKRFEQIEDYVIESNTSKYNYSFTNISDNGFKASYHDGAWALKVSFDPNTQAWEIFRNAFNNRDKLLKAKSGKGFGELLKTLADIFKADKSDPDYKKFFEESETKTVAEEFKEYETLWQSLNEWKAVDSSTIGTKLPKVLYYPCTLVYATRSQTYGIWTGGKSGSGCIKLFTSVDNAILAFYEWYETNWYDVAMEMPRNTSTSGDSPLKFAVLKVNTDLIDMSDWRVEEIKFSNGELFGYALKSLGLTGAISKSASSLEREVTADEAWDLWKANQ